MKNRFNHLFSTHRKVLILSLLVLIALCATLVYTQSAASQEHQEELVQSYIDSGEFQKATELYNKKLSSTSAKGKFLEQFQSIYLSTQKNWEDKDLSYAEASEILHALEPIADENLSSAISTSIQHMDFEEENSQLLNAASEHIKKGQYVDALTALATIDPAFSQYNTVKENFDACEKNLIAYVASPTSLEDFDTYIKLVQDCISIHSTPRLLRCKDQLTHDLTIFIDVSDMIQQAADLYESKNFQESFLLLVLGLQKYPNNERLSSALVDYHDHYIISVTKEAESYYTQEDYKTALKIVDAAIEEYDCEEFHLLRKSIKEQQSLLYRIKNNLVDRFKVMAQGWDSETFDVKQAANNAGSYVMKSGKKLVLGDYTDEDVTLLSFSGNMVASLAGIDALLDLRDLSYDITHWGEEEYFLVHLGTDVLALIPMVGVVKYVSHFKQVADTGPAVLKSMENIDDIGNISKTADAVADQAKASLKAGETVGEGLNKKTISSKVKDIAEEISQKISKEFKPISTRNSKFLGGVHPVTKIPFISKRLTYSDGRKIQGIFPEFPSFADIQLPKELYKSDFSEQKKYCLKKLQDSTSGLFAKNKKHFTQEELDDIAEGILPARFVWHHNEQEGLMQLVDATTHAKTGHTGGMDLWGKGYKALEGA